MKRFIRPAMLVIVVLFASFFAVLPASAKSTTSAISAQPTGVWKTLAPRTSKKALSIIPPGGGSNCPSNSTGYTGSLAQYNCVEIDYDGDLHGVWTRQGSANTFGLNHFGTHNLWMSTVSDVIENSQYGIEQSNGRYLYGAYYESDGEVAQYVQVYEERGRPNAGGVNDGNELGVVTAYCEDEFGNPEQVCPDWVNETL